MLDDGYIPSEEEEEEELDDIPPDSLWGYYGGGGGVPLAFVYFEGTYTGTAPNLSIFPSWAISPTDENIERLRDLTFKEFWELEKRHELARIDFPSISIKLPEIGMEN